MCKFTPFNKHKKKRRVELLFEKIIGGMNDECHQEIQGLFLQVLGISFSCNCISIKRFVGLLYLGIDSISFMHETATLGMSFR